MVGGCGDRLCTAAGGSEHCLVLHVASFLTKGRPLQLQVNTGLNRVHALNGFVYADVRTPLDRASVPGLKLPSGLGPTTRPGAQRANACAVTTTPSCSTNRVCSVVVDWTVFRLRPATPRRLCSA